MHGVEQAESLDRAVPQIAAVRWNGMARRTSTSHKVHRGMAIDDPVGQDLARSARRPDADRIEARRDVQVAHLRRLAQHIAIVRREALGAIEEELNPGLRQHRHATDRGLEQRLDMVEVVGGNA